MDLKQIKATILLYTSEKEYQYKYVIPESAFESINSVEALRDYESEWAKGTGPLALFPK